MTVKWTLAPLVIIENRQSLAYISVRYRPVRLFTDTNLLQKAVPLTILVTPKANIQTIRVLLYSTSLAIIVRWHMTQAALVTKWEVITCWRSSHMLTFFKTRWCEFCVTVTDIYFIVIYWWRWLTGILCSLQPCRSMRAFKGSMRQLRWR